MYTQFSQGNLFTELDLSVLRLSTSDFSFLYNKEIKYAVYKTDMCTLRYMEENDAGEIH
jgi:hypothetical protein